MKSLCWPSFTSPAIAPCLGRSGRCRRRHVGDAVTDAVNVTAAVTRWGMRVTALRTGKKLTSWILRPLHKRKGFQVLQRGKKKTLIQRIFFSAHQIVPHFIQVIGDITLFCATISIFPFPWVSNYTIKTPRAFPQTLFLHLCYTFTPPPSPTPALTFTIHFLSKAPLK